MSDPAIHPYDERTDEDDLPRIPVGHYGVVVQTLNGATVVVTPQAPTPDGLRDLAVPAARPTFTVQVDAFGAVYVLRWDSPSCTYRTTLQVFGPRGPATVAEGHRIAALLNAEAQS